MSEGKTQVSEWIFGYGSLMWDAGFEFIEKRPATVSGWHRRFALLSTLAWGTSERPGLSAALFPGGTCLGYALGVGEGMVGQVTEILDAREFRYDKKEITIRDRDGASFLATTYVRRPACDFFLDETSPNALAPYVIQGSGKKGTSLEYLEKTVGALDELKSGPTSAHALLKHVRFLKTDI